MPKESHKNTQVSLFAIYACILSNILAIILLFSWVAYARNIDGDEGLYLEAARLVSQGKVLYQDFFYQQMPLIPYLYAGWMKLFGFSLMSSRWLSLLLTTFAGTVMLIFVARRSRSLVLVSLYALLFYGSGMVLAWAPVFKTHPINFFCLTLSAVLLCEWRHSAKRSHALLFFTGLAIGVGVNSRLMFLPFLLVYAFFVIFQNKRWFKDLLLFSLVVLLTSIPTLYFFFSDPTRFIQYNFLYHTHIYPGVVNGERRLITAQNVFLQVQMILILIVASFGLLMESRKGWKDFLNTDTSFFGALLILFIMVHMASAEPYTQYFSAMVPLALLTCLPIFLSLKSKSKPVVGFVVVFFLFYLSDARPTFQFEVSSMGSTNPYWELGNFKKAVGMARKLIPKGEECLTWWPGYAVEVGCRSAIGMENHMRNHAIDVGIPGNTLEQYQMMSDEILIEELSDQKYPYIIEGVYRIRGPYADYIDYLMKENYQVLSKMKGVRIWARNSLGSDDIQAPTVQRVGRKIER